ncbi:MAG: prepilin-type N-terminal cleavage/methylation domain-containing protein [Synergistaceae bacterium]|nr:prepilin-type N-terminal cleavage/methylation domain-containing protein [Synergistaceae bacterium]
MKKREAFTLVELLIVIVIIGILASSMMLSSTSATASAEVASIISELRNMKAATMMFYADSTDSVNDGTASAILASGGQDALNLLKRYMDNPEKLTGNYRFVQREIAGAGKKWFVGFVVSGNTTDVKERLQGKAASTGLLGSTATNAPADLSAYEKSHNAVWMVAR